jgi:hypothetical protein
MIGRPFSVQTERISFQFPVATVLAEVPNEIPFDSSILFSSPAGVPLNVLCAVGVGIRATKSKTVSQYSFKHCISSDDLNRTEATAMPTVSGQCRADVLHTERRHSAARTQRKTAVDSFVKSTSSRNFPGHLFVNDADSAPQVVHQMRKTRQHCEGCVPRIGFAV